MELIFISRIMRDGGGTAPIEKGNNIKYWDSTTFAITYLSLENETYIASGFKVMWRFLFTPIRYFMRGKVKQAKRDIKKCNREIELHEINSRQMGKTAINPVWFMHNLWEKQRLERLVERWS